MASNPRKLVVQPVSELESHGSDLLRQVQETRLPVVLTESGRSTAVLVDFESYQELLDEVELFRDVHRGLADAEAGRVTPHDEVVARLRVTCAAGIGSAKGVETSQVR